MARIYPQTVTIYLTNKCNIARSVRKVGETGAGFNVSGMNLKGRTGTRDMAYYTEGLQACTGGIVLGDKLNFFHENSSIYDDAQSSIKKVFREISKKFSEMMFSKDKFGTKKGEQHVQAFLFGGWGYGVPKNPHEVEKSHTLFNNLAISIEDTLPEQENITVPLTTIWGKFNPQTPDAVYVRGNSIVLINDTLKSLFKNGECNMTRDELINSLKNMYEEVQIADDVRLVAKENFDPYANALEKLNARNANLDVTV